MDVEARETPFAFRCLKEGTATPGERSDASQCSLRTQVEDVDSGGEGGEAAVEAEEEQEEEEEEGRTPLSASAVVVFNTINAPSDDEERVPVATRCFRLSDSDLAPQLRVHRALVRTDLLGRLRGGGGGSGGGTLAGAGRRWHNEGLLLAVTSCGAVGGGYALPPASDEATRADGASRSHLPRRSWHNAGSLRLRTAALRSGPSLTAAARAARASSCPATDMRDAEEQREEQREEEPGVREVREEREEASCALPLSPPRRPDELVDILRPRAAFAAVCDGARRSGSGAVAQPRRLFPLSQNVKSVLLRRSIEGSFA